MEPGDEVILKSGGPVMRLEDMIGNAGAKCSWTNDHGCRQTGVFKLGTIETFREHLERNPDAWKKR